MKRNILIISIILISLSVYLSNQNSKNIESDIHNKTNEIVEQQIDEQQTPETKLKIPVTTVVGYMDQRISEVYTSTTYAVRVQLKIWYFPDREPLEFFDSLKDIKFSPIITIHPPVAINDGWVAPVDQSNYLITGKIVDENNNPVEKAVVSPHIGESVKSDNSGCFTVVIPQKFIQPPNSSEILLSISSFNCQRQVVKVFLTNKTNNINQITMIHEK